MHEPLLLDFLLLLEVEEPVLDCEDEAARLSFLPIVLATGWGR